MKKKIKLGPNPYIYPMPVVLVGSCIDNQPNFITVSYCGIVQHQPPMVSITLINTHHTNKGIKENGSFSINIPNTKMLKVTDYVGMNSGERVNKSDLFSVFYGQLEKCPMIMETPLNLECKLLDVYNLKNNNNELFIGEIVQCYSEKKYLRRGKPFVKRLKPILFSINNNYYYSVGRLIGKAWHKGLEFKVRNNNGNHS